MEIQYPKYFWVKATMVTPYACGFISIDVKKYKHTHEGVVAAHQPPMTPPKDVCHDPSLRRGGKATSEEQEGEGGRARD